jgi:hypothetical protein
MPSITLYFKHFACQYFIFRNENAKKTETAHRQKLSTYRETPCKVTKSALKTKKNHTHWKVCKIALNVLANMGAQTALNYAISAHRCSYLIALFYSSPKKLQLRHKDILPSPPSLNNSAQDKEKGEIKTSQRTVYWDESTIGSFGTRRTSSATSKWDPIEHLESNENHSKIITQYHPHLPAIYCDDLSYIIR